MYLLCCAACWFLVQRDVRADGSAVQFPGMKIVPALAIIAIIWILAHATLWEFEVTASSWLSRLFYIRAKQAQTIVSPVFEFRVGAEYSGLCFNQFL